MIKYLMRRTIYKGFDKESQDMLLQLISKKDIIELVCYCFWVFIFIFPFIPLFIIDICENIEISMTTQIAIIAFMLIYFVGLLVFMNIFKNAMIVFSLLLSIRIYFLVCTIKGKAISKNDFNIIKQQHGKIYRLIENQGCRQYCYSICFYICKALKKGYIEFIAAKKFSPHADEEDDGKNFAMHVLYVNNGWAFDTYSCRQYPIEKIHEIYKAKIYKSFSFKEISSKSYDEFREEEEPKLSKWAFDNDCAIFWKVND